MSECCSKSRRGRKDIACILLAVGQPAPSAPARSQAPHSGWVVESGRGGHDCGVQFMFFRMRFASKKFLCVREDLVHSPAVRGAQEGWLSSTLI